MKFPMAAGLFFAALHFVSFEPAHAQPCFSAEACRALRLQQQAAQEQAAIYAQQQAAAAAQQQKQAKAAAAARAAELREAQALADAQAMALAAKQQQEEYDRQQAAIQQAKLIAEQQAAARREADARARLVEETRVANLRAAEESPDNHCREPSVAGKIIEYYNSLVKTGDASYMSVDIEHLITESFDAKARTMSCHGTFVLTNGNRQSGSITARPNVAGNIIVSFHETEH
jgi:hypothetical protein